MRTLPHEYRVEITVADDSATVWFLGMNDGRIYAETGNLDGLDGAIEYIEHLVSQQP